MIKHIVLLGKPGAGKGTIAKLIEDTLNFRHISTGDIFRKEIQNKTTLGNKVTSILKSGKYVPDQITNQIVEKTIKYIDKFILDGYPRTINQAEFLDKICKIDFAILLEVDDKIVINRLSSRMICEKGGHIFNKLLNKPKVNGICDFDGSKLISRKDDQPSAIQERLSVYSSKTMPLIQYYKSKNKLITLNANSGNVNNLLEEFQNKVLNGNY